jgi:regulator of protease activity HflC (stomatin/prohibitin superfamily)
VPTIVPPNDVIEDPGPIVVENTRKTATRTAITAKEVRFFQPKKRSGVGSPRAFMQLLFIIFGAATGIPLLITLFALMAGNWVIGPIFLLLTLAMLFISIRCMFAVMTAKSLAIQRGDREVDLFFRCVKLILWEENEGLLLLKDKRIHQVIYGPECGGGVQFIFPIAGDEVKVHVPLTLQLSEFKDEKVLTRESIQLSFNVALWWKIKDREGLEDFYLLIDREFHRTANTQIQPKEVDLGQESTSVRKRPKRAELNAAERWMLTLVESHLRKLVSRTSVAWIISRHAAHYLEVGGRHDERAASLGVISSPNDEAQATPDSIAASLKSMLVAELEKYGLEIDRVEIQEVRLPADIQDAIDRVWKATLLPAQTEQEAQARERLIKAELGMVAETLGKKEAAAREMAKNMQGITFVGDFPQIVQQLLASLLKARDSEPQHVDDQSLESPAQAGSIPGVVNH